jgi:hypothetical protein
MMAHGTRSFGVLAVLLGVAGAPARGVDLPPDPAGASISDTQLTLQINPVQGRATVIGIDGERLTLVTAAHVLGREDLGRIVSLRHGDHSLRGRVEDVSRNPGFHPIRSRTNRERSADGTLGVDTAMVVVDVDLRDEAGRRDFGQIKAADLSAQPIPGNSGQVVPVHIVDQSGEEHVIRVGNHLNPKSLAWGRRSYDTQRGDSGAGVFVVGKTPAGGPWPILIGVVSQTDERGAIASLVHRKEPWIEEALARRTARPR